MTPTRPASSPPLLPAAPFGLNLTQDNHAAVFYHDEDFLIGVLGDFIVSSVRAGESAVIVATAAHHRILAQRLIRCCGLDLAALKQTGRYTEIDGEEILAQCMVGGAPDMLRLNRTISEAMTVALAATHTASPQIVPRTMVFGELAALLWAKRDLAGVMAVEDSWDRLARRFSFTLLCGYSIREFDAAGTEDSYLRICAAHSTVIPPDAYPSPQSEARILKATARSYKEASAKDQLTLSRSSNPQLLPPSQFPTL